MILNILFILVVVTYVIANIILALVAVNQDDTFEDILTYSQDTKLGKFLMSIFYLPVFVVLKIRSLRCIDTYYSFEDKECEHE